MNTSRIIGALTVGLALIAPATAGGESGTEIEVLCTPGGVRFGVLGAKRSMPAPILFVFATSLEDSLGNNDYVQCGRILAKQGFLCVSLDVPCHGKDRFSTRRISSPGDRAGRTPRDSISRPTIS